MIVNSQLSQEEWDKVGDFNDFLSKEIGAILIPSMAQ